MTDQDQLERDADDIRAGIADTAEAIQDKMNPGKMMEELLAYMKNSDGSLAFSNLSRQARDNPMALAMIGAGMAWLVLGEGRDARGDGSTERRDYRHAGEPSFGARHPQNGADASASNGHGLAGEAQDLGDRAMDATREAAESVRGAAEEASDRARRLRHDASAQGQAAVDKMRSMADRGRRSLADAMDQEPLVLGAIAVAVGAAIGAMLPSTRIEDETFGETRDGLKRDAGQAIDRAAEAASNVGEKALDAAKAEAQTA